MSRGKEIWFIHGANASPLSFERMEDLISADEDLSQTLICKITYNCQESLPGIVEKMVSTMPSDKDIFLVGHSLGGVLAVAASQRIKHFNVDKHVAGIVSLASPFGGSESADYLKWLFPSYHLFKSISTTNRMVRDIQAVGAVVPTLSFVTTSGNNPLFPEANDGVVTVNSQRSLKKAEYVEVPCNHFEVLMSTDVIQRSIRFIKSTSTNSFLQISPPDETSSE